MFLDRHPLTYSITSNDLFLSLVTGASGAPYAKRHWEESKKCDGKVSWGHRAIAVLEALPVVGGIAAVIERISYFVMNHFFRNGVTHVTKQPLRTLHWKARTIASDKTIAKMWKNAEKAVTEHAKKDPASYATVSEALPDVRDRKNKTSLPPLKITRVSDEEQGPRRSMEDVHFFLESDEAVITGVLDGHGGNEIGKLASQKFTKQFFEMLKKTKGNVHKTFEWIIDEIQKEVVQQESLDSMGTTAVLCYIDKRTHLIYTATIGDSEANIYRTINSKLKSVPLSCVRDWSSPKDAKRASIALDAPEIEEIWPKAVSKTLRYPTPRVGVNVSRAIGDAQYLSYSTKAGIIHKPKITMNKLQPGDLVIIACDGLKDYVTEKEIIEQLQARDSANQTHVASQLVEYAINTKVAQDNVTVIAVNVA